MLRVWSCLLLAAAIRLASTAVTSLSADWWKCDDVPGRNFNKTSPGSIIGVLVNTECTPASSTKPDRFCEAALLGPRTILTAYDCIKLSENPSAEERPKLYYSYKSDGKWQCREVTALQRLDGTSEAVGFLDDDSPELAAPFVSFVEAGPGSTEARYNVAPESYPNYPATVSSLLLGFIDDKQVELEFESDGDSAVDVVSLSSEPPDAEILPGATFLKEFPDCRLGVFGVYSQLVTEDIEQVRDKRAKKKNGAKKASGKKKAVRNNKKKREPPVQESERGRKKSKALQRSKKLQRSAFYGGAKIATFNLNWTPLLDRDMGNIVKATLHEIIKETHIIAFQEATGLVKRMPSLPKNYKYVDSKKEFVFIYRSDLFRLFKKEMLNKHTYKAVFQALNIPAESQDKCVAFYSVHLPAGKGNKQQEAREDLLQKITAKINEDREECKARVLLGDFNWPTLRRDIYKFQFRTKSEFSFIPDSIPSHRLDSEDLDEFGETTPKHGVYDYIFITDDVPGSASYYLPPTYFRSRASPKAWFIEARYLDYFVPKSKNINPAVRSSFLSDHLPVVGSLTLDEQSVSIGTWNLQHFDLHSNEADSREKRYEKMYKKVFGLADVFAIQEILVLRIPDNFHKFGVNWVSTVVKTTKGSKESLGFAYSTQVQFIDEYKFAVKPPRSTKPSERQALAGRFKKDGTEFVVVNVHVVNDKSTTWTYRQAIVQFVRHEVNKKWNGLPVFVAGDFNFDGSKRDLANRKKCPIDNTNWEFTRIYSKKVIDYVIAPGPKLPGIGFETCKTIHPERIAPAGAKSSLPAFGSWLEISDHFPVFKRVYSMVDNGGDMKMRT